MKALSVFLAVASSVFPPPQKKRDVVFLKFKSIKNWKFSLTNAEVVASQKFKLTNASKSIKFIFGICLAS